MISAKQPIVRLQHILEQIDGIIATTQGLTFDEIRGNFLYERAIERSVQIISEAAKELPEDLRNTYPDIHWKPIIHIGNLLRHEYYRINAIEMWEIVTIHLSALRPTIDQMIVDIS